METLKKDLGVFIKLLGAVLVVWAGGWVLFSSYPSDNGWCWLPKICGSAMVLAGAAAAILLLWQRTVSIKVDAKVDGKERPTELIPSSDNR
jgi:protein-S-isoprenylcysteine O-methyltransferase Ste14